MAGLRPDTPVPSGLVVHTQSRALELQYADGSKYLISFELLRVESPSAEVKGHGPGQETLQVGKKDVGLTQLDPVGNYAVRPVFSDGHDTGIYSWDYLYDLAVNHDSRWQNYLDKLQSAGASREKTPNGAPITSGPMQTVEVKRRG